LTNEGIFGKRNNKIRPATINRIVKGSGLRFIVDFLASLEIKYFTGKNRGEK
jgi:hypothetical protein